MLPLLFASALAAAPPDAALAAFTLDLQEDGLVDPTGTRTEALLDEACAAGHALSCSARPLPRGSAEALHPLAQAACAAGDPLGCAVAGWTLPEDAPAGADLALYTRSCTEEFPRGCAEQGAAEYRAGDKDGGRARAMAACEAGSGNACLVAAWGLEGPEEDAREERGCALGDQASCYQVAWRRWKKGSKDPDPARGFALFSAACEAGHGRACHQLGKALADGTRRPQDLVTAVGHYERACELGYQRGCSAAGWHLARGVLGERRVADGEALLAATCEAGFEAACGSAAAIALVRVGGLGDTDAVWRDLARGCELGHGSSCTLQGLLQYSGLLRGEPDVDAAMETWEAACFAAEHPEACMPLAQLRAARGEDPVPVWERGCALESRTACRAVEEGGVDWTRITRTVDRTPRAPLTAGLRNRRALDRSKDLMKNTWEAPLAFLQARTVELLVADAPAAADSTRLAPWAPALAAACSVDAPEVCVALGELRMHGDDPVGAAQAWGDGCGIGAARRDSCAALLGVLDTHGRAMDKELRHTAAVTLCSARRGDWCKDAAKGFRRDRPERALEMYAHGCAVKHADSCKQVERSTGAPMAEPPVPRGGDPGPPVHSRLPNGSIDRAVRRRQAALVTCYDQLREDHPDAQGRVRFLFEIRPDGGLGAIDVQTEDLNHAEFIRCAKGALRPATFPRPHGEGVVYVAYPFRFEIDRNDAPPPAAGP